MNTESQAIAPQQEEKKRRSVAAFIFALVAVLGFGAALTTAAWTDNVFFKANVSSAATVNLQGSLDGTSWSEGATSATAIVVPTSTFENLLPGQTRTVTLHVRNQGTTPVDLVAVVNPVAATGVFEAPSPATATVTLAATSLNAGAQTTLELTLTAPANWPASYQGKTGELLVQVTGTAK